MLLITFLMVIGAFNTLATIVSYLCSVWQYTDSEASLFGAMFIVGGIIGSIVFGIFVEKTQKYKVSILIQCFFASVFSFCQLFIFKLQYTWLTATICFL